MARASLIAKEVLKEQAIKRFKAKRDALRDILNSQSASSTDKIRAQFKMQSLPIRSCPIRKVNRCFITGRSRAVLRRFGLSRQTLREMALKGLIPGLKRSSW